MTEHDGPTLSDDERFFAEHSIRYASSADQLPSDIYWEQVSDWLTARGFLETDEQTGKTPKELLTEKYGEAFYAVPSKKRPGVEDSSVKFYTVFGDRNARLAIYAKEVGENAEVITHNQNVFASIIKTFGPLLNGEIAASDGHIPADAMCIESSIGYDGAVEFILHVLDPDKKWYVVPIFDENRKLVYNRVALWTGPEDANDTEPIEIGRHTSNGSWLRVINGGKE